MDTNPEFLGKVLAEQSTELKRIRESLERMENMLTLVFERNEKNIEAARQTDGAINKATENGERWAQEDIDAGRI